jgi:proteic killer suppression protein
LEIHFKDKALRELCEKRATAVKKMGDVVARKLRTRLDDLEAAGRVTDLVAGRPHPLKGDRTGQFAVDLAHGWRLVFAPDHELTPTHPDGGTDWTQVTIICIEYIGDYHD